MDDNFATLLAHVSRLMRRSFAARAREIGVTRPQWQVLSVLSYNSGINQGTLADILEVEPVTAGRMIDRLQDADLVERRADPADRRAWRLYLTPHGLHLVATLRPFAKETVDLALADIDAVDVAAMVATLQRIRGNLVPPSAGETVALAADARSGFRTAVSADIAAELTA